MGCVFSKQRWGKNRSTRPSDPPKTRECTEDAEILSLTEISGPCEAVSDPHSSHHHVSVPPRASVERVMSRLMGSQYDFDLTYITDRVISVLFLPDLEEERYSANLKEVAAVLKSKHQEKILLINLSEKRHDICRLNPKVEEFGWPDLHAPALDKICVVCKIMESWLTSDPNNVIVLHCKGLRGKTAVIAAAYLSYSKISAGADEAALRKFCEDEISLSLQPSQNRYIYYFSGLLSGTIKMNSAPLFLHQVHIPVLPSYKSEEGHSPVLKIYQSLQLVYSSSKYDIHDADSKTLCVNIEPALLLKGDVLLKCYDGQMCKRKCVLRVQFHTCAVHGSQLVFGKAELDHACTDDRFPADATVQLLFSSRHQKTSAGLSVDQGITDAAVRWDSYENFNLHHQDSVEDICHTRGPLDGSLYAQVKKRRAPGFSLSSITHHSSSTPPVHLSIQALSVNSSHPAESLSPPPSNVKRQKPEKDEERNTHRETAILDDVDCSSLKRDASIQSCYSRLFSHTHSFCGSDLTNPHTLAQTLQPKHRTLPCIRTAELPARDLCVSQPDLLRERGCCLHQTCSESAGHLYSRPTQEIHTQSPLTHSQSSQSHTLPPQTHTFFSGEACPLFHCSTHPQSHTHIPPSTHQSLLSSPYRELCYISPPPTSCSCRDCSRLREDVALHSLRGRELEVLPWSRKPEFGFRRDGPVHWRDGRVDSHWEGVQEVENLRHKTALSPVMFSFGHCHTVPKHDPTDTQPEHVTPSSSYSSPQSSGYHSPHAPCACSPPPLRESPGYASISHSLNSSPLALTPSPKRANHNDASDEGSRSCLHDGEVMILEVNDKSHVWPFSPLTQDSTASDATDQEYSSAIERETRPTKTPITQSTPNISSLTRPPSCPDQARMSKGAESTVQIHTHKPNPLIEGIQETDQDHQEDSCHTSSSTSTSPQPPICSSERSSASELPSYIVTAEEQRLTPLTDSTSSKEEISSRASPDPDVTPSFPTASYSFPQLTVPHVPYTGYTAVTIPSSLTQPPLPEKQRASPLQNVSDCADTSSLKSDAKLSASSTQFLVSFSSCIGEVPPAALCKTAPSSGVEELESRLTSKFVQDSSKYWYKPGISRDQAIAVLKDQEPGCFLIRDSNSFQGAYGLALKVATAPAHASNHETGSPEEQLVRHFLIESGARGVKIKGCQNETYFGSLSALVYQHSITPVSLPCMLCIPDKDLVGEMQELQSGTNSRTAADLLKLGAACNVLYLNSVETESLTGPQAVSKATKCTLTQEPRPSPTVVHFKVSTQGITLTDNQRRLFFRRHYPVHSVTFSSVDPLDQRWIDADYTSCKMFGFVARRSGGLGNVCHLFAEIDPEQPATAIVNFINKVMLGRQQLRK